MSDKKFEYVVLQCDKSTMNGRIYPEEIMKEAIKKMKDVYVYSLPDCPAGKGDPNQLSKVLGQVLSMDVKDGKCIATIESIGMKGKDMIALLKTKKFDLGVVGYGEGECIDEDGTVKDFNLKSIAFAPKFEAEDGKE